jgi:hypothetical protein
MTSRQIAYALIGTRLLVVAGILPLLLPPFRTVSEVDSPKFTVANGPSTHRQALDTRLCEVGISWAVGSGD